MVLIPARFQYVHDFQNILTVKSKREVDGFRELIRNYGLVELYSEKYPHAGGDDNYALFFEDPDRIKVEVTCEI